MTLEGCAHWLRSLPPALCWRSVFATGQPGPGARSVPRSSTHQSRYLPSSPPSGSPPSPAYPSRGACARLRPKSGRGGRSPRRACVDTNVKLKNGGGNLGTNERVTASSEPKVMRPLSSSGSAFILILKSFRPREMQVRNYSYASHKQGKKKGKKVKTFFK